MTDLKLAIKTVKLASNYLRNNFGIKQKVNIKTSYDDIVSEIDLNTDKIIFNCLKHTSYNILSEESGFIDKHSAYTWVIDPLDGTANYLNNIPYFGCSIGLAKDNYPILGVISDPIGKNIIYALEGKGCYFKDKKINYKNIRVDQSIIGFDFGRSQKDEMTQIIGSFIKTCRYIRIAGSSVLGFRDAAIGQTQAYIHNNLKPWDACAGTIIVKEAGGLVTNFNGDTWSLKDSQIIASNQHIYQLLMDTLCKSI